MTAVKVLHIAETAGWAGGETYLVTLAQALDRQGFRLEVAVPEAGPLVGRLNALGVPVHQVPLGVRPGNPKGLFSLARLFKTVRPALVQSHGARTNVYTKLAGRLAGVPIVVSTVHNSLFDYEISPFRRWLYVLAERLTSPLADRIVAVSSHITRDLIHRYGISPEQVVTIRNGIEADSFVPARSPSDVLKELNVNNQDRRIGLAARMTPQKGHLVLLQALRLISQRFSNLRCLLIGDGPLRPSLERYAGELGVAGQCVFTGIRSDIADLLSVVEVVVLPSHSEGLPFVLLEAMALAKPVVATRVGGNPEVVEDGKTGLLVPPADPKAMAEAIAFLLDHPDEAACMGKRGRERVVECFGLDRMVKALEQLYLELLDRAGVRSDKDNEGRPYGSCRDGRDRSSR